ncbi:MAG: Veg family protein [Bacilli bacterium]|nr:Veg family protein [Bacilli bacterium]
MNVSDIKEEIESLVNKQIMIKVSGSRSRNQMFKGVVNQVYPNIFTVIVEGNNMSFTYADVVIGDVKIYHM